MKYLSTFFLFFGLFSMVQAQTDSTSQYNSNIQENPNRWTFGGYAGFGGAFGNGGGFSVYVSPRVGYLITENLEAGIAGNVNWGNSEYWSSTMVGVGPFANYYFNRNFFISGMYQHFFVNQKNKIQNYSFSDNEAALYLGGGYMQQIGERSFMQIGGMYNVLYKSNSSVLGGAFIPNIGIVYGL